MVQDTVVDYSHFPRSRLNSAPPIGVGTPLVESVDGYVERLRNVHDVPRKHLECLVTGDLESDLRREGLIEPPRPDSPFESSERFAATLAELTQQPQVARLGLGRMRHAICSQGALKPFHTWCPQCLREAHFGRMTHCRPLVWLIKSVESCPVHEVVLSASCHNCGAMFRPRAHLNYPFQLCPKCAVPVFDLSGTLYANASGDQKIVAKQVGEMLKLLPAVSIDAIHAPNLRKVIDSVATRGLGGTIALTQRAGISKGTLSYLLNGKKGSLDTWVRIAVAADVSLAGLFADEHWREDVTCRVVSWRPTLIAPRRNEAIDWDNVRSVARERIACGKDQGLSALCLELGIDRAYAARVLGHLGSELNDSAAKARAENREREATKLAECLKEVAANLRDNGIRVSARALARHSGISRESRLFGTAYRKISIEMGRGTCVARAS